MAKNNRSLVYTILFLLALCCHGHASSYTACYHNCYDWCTQHDNSFCKFRCGTDCLSYPLPYSTPRPDSTGCLITCYQNFCSNYDPVMQKNELQTCTDACSQKCSNTSSGTIVSTYDYFPHLMLVISIFYSMSLFL